MYRKLFLIYEITKDLKVSCITRKIAIVISFLLCILLIIGYMVKKT